MSIDAAELIHRIEIAFRTIEFPGDDNLVSLNNFGGLDPEREEIREAFRRKHWKDLTARFLLRHRQATFFMSGPGLVYFLPGYMTSSLRDFNNAIDTTAELLNILTPSFGTRESLDEEIAKLTPEARREIVEAIEGATHLSKTQALDRFNMRFSGLTRDQTVVVRDFLRYVRDQHFEEFGEDAATALKEYWDAV